VVDAAPFRALRYDNAVAGDPASTSAPAYDDVERFTYARHRTASPYTVLELLAEGEAADYRAAGAAFARWRRTGVMVEDERPAYYLYDIHELRHGVPTLMRGVLTAVTLDGAGLLAHEGVDPDRVAARARRVQAVPVDLAPVFAVHSPGPPQLRSALDAPPRTAPLIALTDEMGVDHRIWTLDDPEVVASVRAGLAQVRAVIADGHHRYAAALHAGGTEPADGRILTYLVDSARYGPELLAVHRVLRGAGDGLLTALAEDFTVRPMSWPDVLAGLEVGGDDLVFGLRHAGGRSALLVARDPRALRERLPGDRSAAWRSLDTAVWEHIVHPVTGGEVEFRADVDAALAVVDAEPGAALFVLRPANIATVDACAAAGEMMPVKTTWFRPKPRAGLVMRSLHSR
jgi:uncharacterized protein (DUF1015 family)